MSYVYNKNYLPFFKLPINTNATLHDSLETGLSEDLKNYFHILLVISPLVKRRQKQEYNNDFLVILELGVSSAFADVR